MTISSSDIGREADADRTRDLGHLSSAVGHHVINAFAAIVSNAELLRLRPEDGSPLPLDPSSLADMIIETALEAASVARRLIDFTRPMTSVASEIVQLDALVAQFVDDQRQNAGGSNRVEWTAVANPVPPIQGQAPHLWSMLTLLTSNAAEARSGNEPLTITLATEVDHRGWVALEIRDNGKGMEPSVMERAVEPFFSTRPGQLGVGLSIANGIWRRHRGTLSLRSTPGEGTVVRLCVEPLARPLCGSSQGASK